MVRVACRVNGMDMLCELGYIRKVAGETVNFLAGTVDRDRLLDAGAGSMGHRGVSVACLVGANLVATNVAANATPQECHPHQSQRCTAPSLLLNSPRDEQSAGRDRRRPLRWM